LPIALEAMERIAALFVIESSFRGQQPDRRLAARVQYARPQLDELKLFLEGSLNRISGESTLAGAIRYALTR
jgi:transposase